LFVGTGKGAAWTKTGNRLKGHGKKTVVSRRAGAKKKDRQGGTGGKGKKQKERLQTPNVSQSGREEKD